MLFMPKVHQYSETLNVLYQILFNRLEGADLSKTEPKLIAEKQIEDMASYIGGIPLYLPQGKRLKTALEHEKIWHEAKVLK